MNNTKWTLIGLITLGLVGFGYKVHLDQQASVPRIDRGPIAVAAVRGASEEISHPLPLVSNAGVDYVNSLQEDVNMAQKAADKYTVTAKARQNDITTSMGD